ncbi:MAG TPA: hypothetical protein VHL53_16055 [Acidimicrobiia bacterium]|nr:hypothetical protein [Acidimicrobiia bacterium]
MTDTETTTTDTPEPEPIPDGDAQPETPPADPADDTPAGDDGQGDEDTVARYRVLREPYISYPSGGPGGEERQAHAGDVVDDLPEVSIPWMLADGWIETA